MPQVCPIAFREIDGTISRLNALSISFFLIIFLFTHNLFLLYILAGDFLIRIYGQKKYSPFFNVSTLLKKIFHMQTEMVDAGAKRVAAQLGLLFIVLLLVSTHLEWFFVANIITLIFLSCTILEFFFSFCVACELYFILQKFR